MNEVNISAELVYNEYDFHHSALARGYVRAAESPIVIPYKGRFGIGYKLLCHNRKSSNYMIVEYYTKESKQHGKQN